MAESWYYKLMGEEIGPISSHELKLLAQAGTIDFDTPLRPSSSDSCNRASKVRGLFDPPSEPPNEDVDDSVVSTPVPLPNKPESPAPAESTRKSPKRTKHSPKPVTAFKANIIIALMLTSMGFPILSTFRPAPAPTKWEYIIVSPMDALFELEMDKLGKNGWQLVSSRRATGDLGPSSEMILKRESQ
jgi:hypothetical protein